MRNDKLRDKLNNINHDFDNEKLWSSIELPKKKSKRRRFFWLFFLGIMLLGAVTIPIYDYQNNTPQLSTSDEEYDSFKSEPSTMNLADSNIRSDSENMAPLNSSLADSDPKILQNTIQNNAEEPNKLQKRRRLGNIQAKNTNNNEVKLKAQHQTLGVGLNFNNEEAPNNKKVNSKNIEIAAVDRYGDSINNIDENDREKEKNVLLLPLPYFIDILPSDYDFDLIISPKNDTEKLVENSKYKKYGIDVFTLLGQSNHDFGASLDRSINETSLETIAFGLLGQVRINNLELFSGFSFIKHNTLLNQEVQAISLLEGISGPTRKTTTIQYALYNSYQYLDVNLGVGYIFSLGRKWSVSPSFHVSYTLSFDPNGGFINQDMGLVDLSDLEEYNNYTKWQGRAHLEILREFSKNWKIGIITYISTSKTLSNLSANSHNVSSHGVGLKISRYIN